jgi:hypothetical protein
MTNFEFGGSLYANSRQFHDAIAEAYMTAGGNNDADDVREFFREFADETLADEAADHWDLNSLPDYEHAELIEALARLRLAEPVS